MTDKECEECGGDYQSDDWPEGYGNFCSWACYDEDLATWGDDD